MSDLSRVPDALRIEVIDDATATMYRAMTPAARVALAARAHQTARVLISAGVRARFPDWTEADVAREVARRLSGGTALFQKKTSGRGRNWAAGVHWCSMADS